MVNLFAESVALFASLSARLAGGRILAVQDGLACIIDEAIFGRSAEVSEDAAMGGAVRVEYSDRDFIVPAAHYAFDGLQVTPADGARFVVCDPDHQAAIAGVDQSERYFRVAGDRRGDFPAAGVAAVLESTGNDGLYTVAAAGSIYDADSDYTTIPVDETITNATADGTLQGCCDLYEAAPVQGGECYRDSDSQGVMLRIHTKRVKHV